MMKKFTTTQDLGDGGIRHKVKYESDICEPDSFEGKTQVVHMLKCLSEIKDLLYCEQDFFEVMSMRHNGSKWVIELIVDKKD